MITVAAFVPLFTMQGVEGQIFGPMARTYGYALLGALIATFTVTPAIASFLIPAHVKEVETAFVRALRAVYAPALRWALDRRWIMVALGAGFLIATGLLRFASAPSSCLPWRKAITGSEFRCPGRWVWRRVPMA